MKICSCCSFLSQRKPILYQCSMGYVLLYCFSAAAVVTSVLRPHCLVVLCSIYITADRAEKLKETTQAITPKVV